MYRRCVSVCVHACMCLRVSVVCGVRTILIGVYVSVVCEDTTVPLPTHGLGHLQYNVIERAT